MRSEKAHIEKIRTAIEYYARTHQEQVTEQYARDENVGPVPSISIMWGTRYARIVTAFPGGPAPDLLPGSRSVVAFVDLRNGDVLKPAGWKGPAKHARGNVLDVHRGLGSTTAHGVAYLR